MLHDNNSTMTHLTLNIDSVYVNLESQPDKDDSTNNPMFTIKQNSDIDIVINNVNMSNEERNDTHVPPEDQNMSREERNDTPEDQNLAHMLESLVSNMSHREQTMYMIKSCTVLCTMIIELPFIISSLYYLVNDTSCLHEPVKHIAVNLYIYLKVDVIECVLSTCLLILNLCSMYKNNYVFMISKLLFELCYLFEIAWTIVGSVIFWRYMDTSKCDDGIYTYMFVLFIMNYVALFMALSSNNDE